MNQSFRTNLDNVAKHYTRLLKIRITETTLKNQLSQNPNYPSLYSLSNVFDRYKIANQAFTIDESSLNQIIPPFITHCSGQSMGKDFVLVTKITDSYVTYLAENDKPKQIGKEKFLKQWQKIVFVAETNEESGEKNYIEKKRFEYIKAIKQNLLYAGIVGIISLMIYLFLSTIGGSIVAASTITVIKLLGLAVTVLLLVYDIDKTNTFVKNICTAGKQTNCDAVLNSKAGKFFGMSWGEVGFFYFMASLLFLLLPGLNFINKLPWLAIASLLAAPYILFSVYYQWKVAKQWCPLCLAVLAILAMELTWSIVNYLLAKPSFLTFTNISTIVTVIICILLPVIFWFIIKPILLKAEKSSGYYAAYKRLLYNPETFNNLLQQQASVPNGWQLIGIDIGNVSAKNTILKVCNPFCPPCAMAHPILEEIVKRNKDIKVKIIFVVANDENDRGNKTVKHLLAIAAKNDLQLTEQALDTWYMADNKDYEVFASKYPMNGELKQQEVKLTLMNNWCKEAEIRYTPTIFINGKQLPETYSIDQLRNIF